MIWHSGPPIIQTLEDATISADGRTGGLRFPVQCVLRPDQSYRGFAGQLAAGVVRVGDRVNVLPSNRETRVKGIHLFGRELAEARAPQSVTLTLADEIDVSRGDLIAAAEDQPVAATDAEVTLVWMAEAPLDPAKRYAIKHTTNTTTCKVSGSISRLDVHTLARVPAATLRLNEIGRARMRFATPLFVDPYDRVPTTGSFILIDETSNATVAAGTIATVTARSDALDIAREPGLVTRLQREGSRGARSVTMWLTGLPGAGKSTLAKLVEKGAFEAGLSAFRLDGDDLRHGISKDLGFTDADRRENIRRAAEIASLFNQAGVSVICALISPAAQDRAMARTIIGAYRFIEVFVDAPLAVCEGRDPKGLYAKARAGCISGFTGVSAPYEVPATPDLHIVTNERSVEQCVADLIGELTRRTKVGS